MADERYSPQVGLHYGGVVFGFYKTAIRKMKNRESNREEKIAVFVNRGESLHPYIHVSFFKPFVY